MVDCPHLAAVCISRLDLHQLKNVRSKERRRASPRVPLQAKLDSDFSCTSNLASWNCVECGTSEEPWLCLSCGLIHCGRYVNRDGLFHFNLNPSHTIGIQCYTYEVYCYKCDGYVGSDTVDLKISSVRASLTFHNLSRQKDHCYSSTTNDNVDESTEEEDKIPLDVIDDTVRNSAHDEVEECGSVLEDDLPSQMSKKGVPHLEQHLSPSRKRKMTSGDRCGIAFLNDNDTITRNNDVGKRRGLKNLGNTCFMNAVVQALNGIDVFHDYMVNLPILEPECTADSSSALPTPRYMTRRAAGENIDNAVDKRNIIAIVFVEELRKVLIELQQTSVQSFSPDSLFNAVWSISPRFRGFQQQDSHELLRGMLDRLHGELRRCRLPAESEQHVTDGRGDVAIGTIVTRLFEGALLSQVTCLSCDSISNKCDPFMDLSLDIFIPTAGARAATVKLEDCVRRFFDKEQLDCCEQYNCPRCLEKRPSTKQLFIRLLPNVICFHLKRFRWSHVHRGKLDNMVEFPLSGLDMTSFVDPQSTPARNGISTSFDLSSLVVHHGSGVSSGHYTAYAQHDGRWYHYNDATVKACSEQSVLKQKAYLLFYVKSRLGS